MKLARMISIVVASVPFAAFAAGPWDGIYDCALQLAGKSYQAYATVNGQPDGRAIITWPAMSAAPMFSGYGLGTINGAEFTGSTWVGHPFRLVGNSAGFSGEVTVPWLSGTTTQLQGNCTRIW